MSSIDTLDSDQAGLLSDVALAALNLRQQPFVSQAADGDRFSDQTTEDQLGDIKDALINGDDLLLIMGSPGSGKSQLLDQLSEHSGSRIQCFSVKGSPRFSTYNLFAGMLEAFKRKPSDDLKLMLDELIPCLQGMLSRNTLSTIVLDDANSIPEPELTKLLSGMLYVNSRDETLLRVALATDTEFESRIPDLLPEGADLPYSGLIIEPLDDDRAGRYLEFRLNQAGGFDEFPLNDKDVSRLNALAGGNPQALHVAAADELNRRFGPIETSVPPELLESNGGGFLSGAAGKFALGALACVLIVGGLLSFGSRQSATNDSGGYTVVENRPVAVPEKTEELQLIDDAGSNALSGASSATSSLNAGSTASVDNNPAPSNTESASAGNAATSAAASTGASSADATATESSLAAADPVGGTNADAGPAPAAATLAENPTDTAPAPSTDADASTVNVSAATGDSTPAVVPEDTEISDAALLADTPATEPAIITETAEDRTQAADIQSETADDSDAAADPEPAPTPAPPIAGSNLESPNWVLLQDAEQFTIQMSASTDRASVERFLSQNELDPPNSIFAFQRNGTTWHALVHGLYPSIDAARAAINRMPESARSNQPWIRAIGRLQNALREQN